MVWGVFVSPATLVAGIVAVILALIVPFFLIEAALSPLPEPYKTYSVAGLSYFGMPLLLCYLHKRQLFRSGFGSGFFALYTLFYLGFGIVIGVGSYYAEGGPNIEGMAAGVVMGLVGCAMVWWRTRTARTYDAAVQQDLEARAEWEREEAIQMQAEAILRAEEMRNSDNS
jgi:membrane associated rhomboid family serine protease